MAAAADIRALEASCPWVLEEFKAGLSLLSDSTAAAARQFAGDARVLAELIAMVPRCAMDERGATPWTSLRREVAVARKISDQAAAAEIRIAVRLTSVLPHTMDLLEASGITVQRVKAFLAELDCYDDELAGQLDTDLADHIAKLSSPRIVQEVRRAALLLDPDSAALRTAVKNSSRGVLFTPDSDDQASITLFGPAVPLTRWYGTLDERARALKQAGDLRPLDAMRFDLATGQFPCASHAPADATATATAAAADNVVAEAVAAAAPDSAAPASEAAPAADTAAAGLRPNFVEAASTDCRRSRPVQAMIVVPVETSLGLSNDPAWMDGYGWLSAPTARQLLVDAELRQLCAQTGTGAIVDLARRDRRPPPTPDGLRNELLEMVGNDWTLTDLPIRSEAQHDPSDPLRAFVTLRDRSCDGPTGSRAPATACHLDHDTAYPTGPTAAWNLVVRAARTHQLKHYGWTPLRTPDATFWTSPAGQIVEVPRHTRPCPGTDRGTDLGDDPAALPEPWELAVIDRAQTTTSHDDLPPWLPTSEQDTPDWTWLHDTGLHDSAGEPAPF